MEDDMLGSRYDRTMSPSPLSPQNDHLLIARLQLCVSVCGLLLVGATWPLWWPSGDYPLIPWFWALLSAPISVDRALAWGLVLSGATVALLSTRECLESRQQPAATGPGRPWLFPASAVWITCLVGSVLLDQQRFQVWAWEFFWLTLFLNLAPPRVAIVCCRVFVIGIYAYSAISKFDVGFIQTQGPWLLDGLRRAIGLNAPAWGTASHDGLWMFPVGELLASLALCFRRTRRWGIVGSGVMHLSLLLALGPLGWNQKPGVLIWNLFFLVSVPLLFWPRDQRSESYDGHSCPSLIRQTRPSVVRDRLRSLLPGERFCVAAVVALSIWPALEGVRLCDHWPAWAVYSSRPEIVSIQVSEDEISLLPLSLQAHIGPPEPLSPWHPISIDHWSFEQRHCPTYPQARYRLAIARHLEETCGVALRVIEQSTPARWTGLRQPREIKDLVADCHSRFCFCTQSRHLAALPLISVGDRMIALTAQLSVACYAVSLLIAARRGSGSPPSISEAFSWTAGLFGLLAHVACAFHFLHHWSHSAALRHTALRTAEVTGWDWPGGLYVNYAFLLFWGVDVVRVWREASGAAPVATLRWRRMVHGVFLFMMFNATVVFGPWHWTVACIVFAAAWWFVRRINIEVCGNK